MQHSQGGFLHTKSMDLLNKHDFLNNITKKGHNIRHNSLKTTLLIDRGSGPSCDFKLRTICTKLENSNTSKNILLTTGSLK